MPTHSHSDLTAEAMSAAAPANGLSPAEAERLALLIEECGETAQAAAKVLRHGYNSHNPNVASSTNRVSLARELGDVCAALQLMERAGDIDAGEVQSAKVSKLSRVRKWLHHQPETNHAGLSDPHSDWHQEPAFTPGELVAGRIIRGPTDHLATRVAAGEGAVPPAAARSKQGAAPQTDSVARVHRDINDWSTLPGGVAKHTRTWSPVVRGLETRPGYVGGGIPYLETTSSELGHIRVRLRRPPEHYADLRAHFQFDSGRWTEVEVPAEAAILLLDHAHELPDAIALEGA